MTQTLCDVCKKKIDEGQTINVEYPYEMYGVSQDPDTPERIDIEVCSWKCLAKFAQKRR